MLRLDDRCVNDWTCKRERERERERRERRAVKESAYELVVSANKRLYYP
jgi:hypothetical protein